MSIRVGLPRWQCHKIVHGFKITEIELLENSAQLHYQEGQLSKYAVPLEYITKHNPQVGGYYVVYDEGYESYSPAKAFENGYTRIPDTN